MLNVLYLLLGIALLTGGGESLIRGALAISKRLGVSPLLSGLVIVGFGTSMPELVVSLQAVLGGQASMAVGNVVGSNIANVLLILGLCAIVTPLSVTPIALRRDAAMVIVATLMCIGLAWGQGVTRIDAGILLLTLAGYLGWSYWSERSGPTSTGEVYEAEAAEIRVVPPSAVGPVVAVVLGLALLVVGSQILLRGAVGIAQALGVSESVIGLTLVAVGTSLPELTVSVMAAVRKHADVAVGNVLGSNIMNLLGILGTSSLLRPIPMPERIAAFDQWFMLGVSVLLYVFLYTGRRVTRLEGWILFLGYLGYAYASYAFIR